MIILLRYLSREILGTTLGVGLILLLIFLSQRFVKYLGYAAAGELDAAILLPLLMYRTPSLMESILPLSLFIAVLLAYGRLYLDNEMRVLFAAGISRLRLLCLTAVPVMVVAGLVAFITMWLSPWCLERVQLSLKNQEDRSELDSLVAGKFQPFRDGSGVIYAEDITSGSGDSPAGGKQMHRVYIFQGQGSGHHEDEVVIVAERGSRLVDARGQYLLLENGYRLRTIAENQRMERIDFARYGQRIEAQHSVESQKLKVDAVSSAVLRASDQKDYRAAWLWRVSLVLLVPIVALLAVALGKADARQGRYNKILPAILLYLLYLVLLNMARDQLAEGKMPGATPFVMVHSLFLLVGIFLFYLEDIRRYLTRRPIRNENT